MFDGEPREDPFLRRFWLATSEAPGFGGGIGVYAGQTARMMARHGVAVTVLHHDPATAEPVTGFVDGYRLIRFGRQGLDRRPIPHANLQGPLRASRELSHVVCELIASEGAPEAIEVQDYAALAHAFLKHRLMHVERDWPPVILTAHRPHLHCLHADEDSVHEHTAAFLGEMERWCYAAADAVFAPCRFILEPLARLGFPVEGTQVVANPWDGRSADASASHLQPQALELGRALHTPEEPLLVFAKLQRQKGVPDLLRTLDALHTAGEAPPAWLFGRDAFLSGTPTTAYDDGERRHRRLFAEGCVRYFGSYRGADVARLCRSHPIAVLPYREDCLPYAFIEAVSAGALPLTSAKGGQLELVPPELRALLSADVQRPDDWGQAARRLLALNPDERAALSAKLQASVRTLVDPAAVFADKLERLRAVRPRYRTDRYPFVQPLTTVFADEGAPARSALAQAVPQRGATRAISRSGPVLQPRADLISVVVPYYEMQAYLAETLAAIEAQDHAAVEIIVVDDGSPSPQARAELDRLMAAPRRFPTRALTKTNGGLSDARNAGARVAQGTYLYFLDADDLIHPSTFSRSLALLKRFRNVAYVGAGLKEFGDSQDEWAVHDVDGPYLAFHNLQICAFLVRAEAWLRHGVNDPGLLFGMEDYDSHIGLFAAGARGIAIPEPLFSYRKRAGSMSKGFDAHAVAFLYRRIARNHPDLLRRFGPELAGLHAENGHGALAPSVCEPSAAHRALFARDLPDRTEIAAALEQSASRDGLGRALRARCGVGGSEWDYTAARLLLALDREPAFARQLLRAAVNTEPANGWFRLYAMVAELRHGRIGAADALWTPGFEAFCRAEATAVDWVLRLEALRGFTHVGRALGAWFGTRAGEPTDAAELGLLPGRWPQGPFCAVQEALQALHDALAAGRSGARQDEEVRTAAHEHLSQEATAAMLGRWRRTWAEARAHPASPTFWGRTAGAYLDPCAVSALDPLERADQASWATLSPPRPSADAATARSLISRGLRRLTRA